MIQDEIFTAIQGLKKLLSKRPLEATKKDILAVSKYKDTIKEAVQSVITPKSSTFEFIQFDELDALKTAIITYDPTEMYTTAEPAIAEARNTVLTHLQSELPIEDNLEISAMLDRHEGAARSNDTRFLWACRIGDNPLHIFELMQTTRLTKFDVQHLQAMYPDLYKLFIELFIEALIEELANTKRLPRRLALMSSVLLQVPVINPNTLKAYKIPNKPKPTDIKIQASEGGQ